MSCAPAYLSRATGEARVRNLIFAIVTLTGMLLVAANAARGAAF